MKAQRWPVAGCGQSSPTRGSKLAKELNKHWIKLHTFCRGPRSRPPRAASCRASWVPNALLLPDPAAAALAGPGERWGRTAVSGTPPQVREGGGALPTMAP
eukprot:3190175-Prymnesium_polylepis.1